MPRQIKNLPSSECDFLRVLKKEELYARAQELHRAGWSVTAIANAFDPPRPRSTVHTWLSRTHTITHSQALPLPLSSSFSSSSSIAAAENNISGAMISKRERRVYTPSSPRLLSAEKERIKTVAPLARMYRARANPNGVYASANNELTKIAEEAYARGVAISELASAAGVTYRAMARRLGK
jgi:hypothetical protein